MVRMLNLTTFDIMGDLTFGDSLNLLAGTGNCSWVSAVFVSIKTNSLRRLARYAPWTAVIVQRLIPKELKQQSIEHYEASQERVDRRIDGNYVHKPDIWGIVMSQKEDLRLSRVEMYANSQVFMVAGTETTATALSGLLYHLLRTPEKMEIIVEEVRATFEKDSDIDMRSLEHMTYLNACIEEGLRMYPPVPVGLPRIAPDEGLLVCGEHIPGKVFIPLCFRRLVLILDDHRLHFRFIIGLPTTVLKTSDCQISLSLSAGLGMSSPVITRLHFSHSHLGLGTALGRSMFSSCSRMVLANDR